jgi:hypothetical protein
MRWAGYVARMEERGGVIEGFVGETWGKETIWKNKAYMGG